MSLSSLRLGSFLGSRRSLKASERRHTLSASTLFPLHLHLPSSCGASPPTTTAQALSRPPYPSDLDAFVPGRTTAVLLQATVYPCTTASPLAGITKTPTLAALAAHASNLRAVR